MDKRDDIPKFKILLIGPAGTPRILVGVGKTSLLVKYVHNKFSYDYQVTTGIQFFTKEVQINEKNTVNLQIWDTMGQEAFKSVVKSHYKGVAAVMFFYSIEKRESYEKLNLWVREVKENVHQETAFFLIGTKLDLQDVRKVGKEEGESYCKTIKAVFFQEISSKTGEYVKQVFDKLSKHLFKKYQSNKSFKELVKPKIDMMKTESFRLKRQDGIKKGTQKEKGACC